MVGIAQLVEHLVVVQRAAGSSPVTHPSVQRGGKVNRRQSIYADTVRETTEGVAKLSEAEGVARTSEPKAPRKFKKTSLSGGLLL